MTICAVKSCHSDSRKHTKYEWNITFHSFPKTPDELKKWMDALNRPNWEPKVFSRICSLHFHKSCFYDTKFGHRNLVKGAVPSLLLEDPVPSEDGVPQRSKYNKNVESSPLSVLKETDTPALRKLKKQALLFEDIARRRRKRCEELQNKQIGLKKKVKKLSAKLKDLQTKCRCKNNQCNGSSDMKKRMEEEA